MDFHQTFSTNAPAPAIARRQPAVKLSCRIRQADQFFPRVAASSLATIRQKSLWLTGLCLGLLPLIPSASSPISLVFLASFGLLMWVTAREPALEGPAPAAIIFLGLFYGLAFLSLFVAHSQGTAVSTWLRGLVPFLFLVSTLCYRGFRTIEDLQDAIDCLQAATCVWALKIFAMCGPAIVQVLTGQLGRLTYACMDTLIPFGLLGYLLALTNPSLRFARYRLLMLSGFGLLVVACAYRSHILLCVLATVIVLYRSHPLVLVRSALGICAVGLAACCCFPTFVETSLWENVGARFQDAMESDDLGTRGYEIEYAWNEFLLSPFWGHGLGHQIPVEVVFDFSASKDAGGDEESVGYIHNVWMYMLMDLGLTGFLAYVGYFLLPVLCAVQNWRIRDRYHDLQFCAAFTVTFLMIYTSCQAAFRLIQFNVVLGLLVAVLCVSPPPAGAKR